MTVTLARLIGNDAVPPKGAEALAVAGLTADSREVKPGFVFAALPGTSVDGAQFIPQAIAKGAAAIVCAGGAAAPGGSSRTDGPEWPARTG